MSISGNRGYPSQGADQFRLRRIQLYNWGTFSGIIDIAIPEAGFLIAGPSGSGKSTILDAHSALYTPPRWLSFNAAARENERMHKDRNWVTYIRGAWANQSGEQGEYLSQYLRAGTTWTAIAETYENSSGKVVTLAQLLWITGRSTAPKDAKRLFLIFERKLDIRELQVFAESDFDIRQLKADLPDAFIHKEFAGYQERMCRLLGIENERALRLLHKTQSAKNLGDLNVFMREFMLDEPETYTVADRLVNEFVELSEAHHSVVAARKQIETLQPARESFQRYGEEHGRKERVQQLSNVLEHYREYHRRRLLIAHMRELEVNLEGAKLEAERLKDLVEKEKEKLTQLEQSRLGLGAHVVDQLQRDLQNAEEERPERIRKRDKESEACQALGWSLAQNPSSFLAQAQEARSRLESAAEAEDVYESRSFELRKQKETTQEELGKVLLEVQSLERQRSNLPAYLLSLRARMAAELRIPEEELPFVGELLEVRSEAQDWHGAIERVLGGFARSMVIQEQHYAAVSKYVNGRNIGGRLAYLRMVEQRPERRATGSRSLIHKLEIAQGVYAAWLRAELIQRFDFACVESMQEFRSEERAVTREGQIKHNAKFHEKDDSSRIDDPSRWVIGFNNQEKLTLYQNQARVLADALAGFERELTQLRDKQRRERDNLKHCQTLANLTWKEVDTSSILQQIEDLQRRLDDELKSKPQLKDLEKKIQAQKGKVDLASDKHTDAESTAKTLKHAIQEANQKLERLTEKWPDAHELPENAAELDSLIPEGTASLTLDNLDRRLAMVVRELGAELRKIDQTLHQLRTAIEKQFAEYNRLWPAEAGGLDPSIASTHDYMHKLERLETDDLPRFEERFFQLLREQSDQILTLLSTKLDQERTDIKARMELVNESLRETPFNEGTRLVIEISDRHLEEVAAFRAQLKAALGHSFSADAELAERRFQSLASLVKRLGSQETTDKNWRSVVLDVRQHVEFVARELDENGEEIEVYRSGAGKSGGQRQKLAATCLAAALRYQLGGVDRELPVFSTIALDEAFDKADAEFTAMAMNIFKSFGFQMVVATPMKSVMTLEPFIGGACFVNIKDRKNSAIVPIEFDQATGRLNLSAKGRHEVAVS